MELNISEFDDVEDVGLFDDNTFIPHVKPILKPILKTQPINPSKKKQVTYDDILSSLNMTVVDGKLQIVRNNVLEKGKANVVESNINAKVNASNVNSKINSKANINYYIKHHYRKQLLDIDRELSELSSIMVDGNTELESTDIPIQKHIKYLKQPKVLTRKVVNPITRKRNRKENKHKKLLYKTPLPKTIRIHYKTPRQNRKKSPKKKTVKRRKHPTENNKQSVYKENNGFTNFFRNLSK